MDNVINFPALYRVPDLPRLPGTEPLPAGTTPVQISALLDELDAAFDQVEQHLRALHSAAQRAAAQPSEDAAAAADQWHSQYVQPLQELGWCGAWVDGFYGLSACVHALAAHLHEWVPVADQVERLDGRHGALGAALETVANIIEEAASVDESAR